MFIIVNWLTKLSYYIFVKVTINVLYLVKVILYIVIKHYKFLDLILLLTKGFFLFFILVIIILHSQPQTKTIKNFLSQKR